MEIHFCRKNIRILRYIRWHKNATINQINKKFGDDADSFTLVSMCKAGYLVSIKEDGSYSVYDENNSFGVISGKETFWVTPKGQKILDDRFDRFWMWSIPTLISVVALVISAFALYNS